jgi:serine/threonine-protein kinase
MYIGRTIAISLVTSFLVSVIVCSVFLFVLPKFTAAPVVEPKEVKVEVPNIMKLTAAEAKLILENKGLLMMTSEEKEDPTVPPGSIITQDPLPGFMVEKGALVKVVVSGGGPKVVIPNLQGIPQGQARLQLESVGLVMGTVSHEDNESVPKDAVVSTDPTAGTSARPGTVVNLKLSSGESSVTVPGVFKMSPGAARSKLEGLGLKVDTKYTTNIDYDFNIVVGQDPRSGTQVKKGSSVTIFVNAEER